MAHQWQTPDSRIYFCNHHCLLLLVSSCLSNIVCKENCDSYTLPHPPPPLYSSHFTWCKDSHPQKSHSKQNSDLHSLVVKCQNWNFRLEAHTDLKLFRVSAVSSRKFGWKQSCWNLNSAIIMWLLLWHTGPKILFSIHPSALRVHELLNVQATKLNHSYLGIT